MWKHVEELDRTIDREAERLTGIARVKLNDELSRNRAAWRTRLTHDAAEAWGGGPFGIFLRIAANFWGWVRWLPLLRMRGVGGLVAAGAVGAGQAVAGTLRDDPTRQKNITGDSLGWSAGELAQTCAVVAGMAEQAGLPPADRDPANDAKFDEVLAHAQRTLADNLDGRIATRIARQTRVWRQIPYELAFCALPGLLLARWGHDFFYKHLWEGGAPTSWEVILQGLLWIVVWGWLCRVVSTRALMSGWRQDAQAAVAELTPQAFARPLFDDIGAKIGVVAASRREFERLRSEIETWRSRDLYRRNGWSHAYSTTCRGEFRERRRLSVTPRLQGNFG
ncbi:MAG: hypothetical protein QM811_29905 [Pirellulales bacterium]